MAASYERSVQAPADRVPHEGESLFRSARPDYEVDANGCWIWVKSLTSAGYPSGYAHRLYWERANGARPAGYDIHHKCHTPACVNPAHLEAVDPRVHDIEHFLKAKGWTLDFIREVRAEGRKAGARMADVSRRYGVNHQTIYNWWNDRTWTDLLDDGPVITPGRVCALEECDNVCEGNRHKRYCCAAHRGLAGERRRRAGVNAPGGKTRGTFYDVAVSSQERRDG